MSAYVNVHVYEEDQVVGVTMDRCGVDPYAVLKIGGGDAAVNAELTVFARAEGLRRIRDEVVRLLGELDAAAGPTDRDGAVPVGRTDLLGRCDVAGRAVPVPRPGSER